MESRSAERSLEYRITEEGMKAKTAPIPAHGRKKRGDGDCEVVQPDQGLWLDQAGWECQEFCVRDLCEG